MADLKAIQQAVISGDVAAARRLTQQAVEEGAAPPDIFRQALAPAMEVVGQKMKNNEYYIPEVLLSTRAMKGASEFLKPLLVSGGGAPSVGRVVLGTVYGDLHDIGKNLVGMLLEGAGFEVLDLGINVPAETFVTKARETGAQIIGMSALLTTTMLRMRDVVEALQAAGYRDKVKVLVGGAPLTQRFADEIGADGYAPEAATGVEMAKRFVMAARGA